MSCGLRNPCFTTFSLVSRCKWPVINVTLLTLKKATQNTRQMGYFPIVLMILFELGMFELDIHTNMKHLWSEFSKPNLIFISLQLHVIYSFKYVKW